MVGTRRNLAPVFGADRTTGHKRSRDGGPNLILADVIVSAQSHVMLRNAGNEPARAVGAYATGKPPVQGGVLTCGGPPRVTQHRCKGCSSSCDPARLLFAASDTVRKYKHSNGPILAGSYQN